MERQLLRRAGYVAGGLIVVAGAIVVLRNTDTSTQQKPRPAPPIQTTVRQYADESVVVQQAGPRPQQPTAVKVTPGPHRLQVSWTKKGDVPGYEVQLRANGNVERTELLAGPTTQFDGLEDNTEYQVDVRAVDSYGQRSDPVSVKQRPSSTRPDESKYALLDHFDGDVVPDPTRWRLANNAACARMTRGVGDDSRRLVIGAACGSESVALRSRTPLRLKEDGDELGRVMIETDAPGADGSLTIDLVPGPVDLIEASSRGGLPPGTIRVQITPETLVVAGKTTDMPVPHLSGLSTRWEIMFHKFGLLVLRDGAVVGGADVARTWTEATPLFSFTGSPNGLNYVGIDAIGLSSADTPPYLATPRISATNVGPSAQTELFAGAKSAQLRMTVRSTYGVAMDSFTVEVGGRTFPARPAVPGQVFEPGLRYPIVADLPVDALLLSGERRELRVFVHGPNPNVGPAVEHVDLELVPDPAVRPKVEQAAPPPEPAQRPRLTLAPMIGSLLDASGKQIEDGQAASPRGRLVLDVTITAASTHVGLAGVEVWVDDKRIVGIPTTRDGPAVGGHWRIALNTSAFQVGVRNLELRAISTDREIPPQLTAMPWRIPG